MRYSLSGLVVFVVSTMLLNAVELQRTGWNLIAVCHDMNSSEIDMTDIDEIQAQDGRTLYSHPTDEQYSNLDQLEVGYGYWVKGAKGVIFAEGVSATPMVKPLLREGWNLMAACEDRVVEDINMSEITEIQSQEGASLYTGEFAHYSNLLQLNKGYGYWVSGDAGVLFRASLEVAQTNYYAQALTTTEQQELSSKIIRMQKPNEIRIDALLPDLIEIAMIPRFDEKGFERLPIDINATHNTANFTITSTDDPNYATPRTPVKSGLKRRLIYAPIDQTDLRILERIYLSLPYSLQEGSRYQITIDSTISDTTHQLALTYHQNRLSSIIHIDPEGYLPQDKKKAYLGMQLGSLGEVVANDLSFSVKKSDTWEVVYSGVGTIEASSGWRENFTNLDTLYQNVVQFDFSAVTETGEYIIESPIAGISQPFIIENDAYRKTLNTLALGIYNQRRGEDIVMPYSRHERLATIEDHTYVYCSDDLDPFITGDSDFDGIQYPTENEGQKVTFEAAGHMDAGDYSPYTYNSSELTWMLLAGLDLFGAKLGHDNLGVPESNDGVPDIYQEMMLELKWLMGMQDSDGGVFGMSKPKGMSYQNTMTGVDTDLERYLSPKDTPHTASFAAVMARAARSAMIQQYNPELRETLRAKALSAWAWLEQNSGYDGWHHYGAAEGDVDDRVWAAIELYALTGETKYHDYFVANHQPELRDNGVEWFNNGYGYANRVVAMWDAEGIPYPIDSTMKTQSTDRYKAMLDHYIDLAEITPYDLILEGARKRWNQLGWYFPIAQYGYDLAIGHALYGEEQYLDLLKDQIHFTLGANPTNSSAMTGLGNKRLHTLVDQKSRYDTLDQPVNGLPVSPIVSGASWLNTYERNLTEYSYPKTTYDFSDGPAYGLLDEVYDGWNVNAEFTIEKLGAMLVALGYITEVEHQTYDYPRFTIGLTPIENGKFQAHLNFEKKPQSGKVVWNANGVPVSVDPNFILEQDFSEPTYKLAAEFIDTNGRRWFDETLVNTRDCNNRDIPLEPFVSAPLTHIWHFDINLSSDSGLALSYQGNAQLDSSNLYWMQHPSGQALRVENYGDGVKSSIYMEDILAGRSLAELDAVTVEALIYPEKFLPRGERTAEMIKFSQSWGAQLQLLRFTWDEVIKTRLAKLVLGEEGKISEALTEHEWHHVKMKIDRYRVHLFIDGQELYSMERVEANLKNLFDSRVIEIYLGDFQGWIDEFRVSLEVSGVHQDSDGDGLPDSWERAYGFDIDDPNDVQLDSDGDGYSNLEEYRNLTDPHTADSYRESVGTELSGVVDWTTQLPFVDYFKFSREWITQCEVGTDENCNWSNSWDTNEEHQLDLDDQGWVKSLPNSEDNVTYSRVGTVWDMPKTLPKGRYVVLYDGEGSLAYRGGANKIESTPGRDLIEVDITTGLIHLQIVSTDPNQTGDYIRNIRMIKEQDEGSKETFNPDFLEKIRPFKVLRFMDWQRINNSNLATWQDRPRTDDVTYATDKGIPVETMVALANKLQRTPWFNIPHQADDNFVKEFAKTVKKTLDTNIPIYLEYSNEVWNSMFEQSGWVENQAQVLWSDSGESGFTKKINWYGKRTAEVCEIFKAEFSDQPQRVQCVMGSQAANSWTATQALDCPMAEEREGCSENIDALAIAPYFGGYLGSPTHQATLQSWTEEYDKGLSKLFTELSYGGEVADSPSGGAIQESFRWIENNRAVADIYNLDLVAYEAGQHLVGYYGVENNEAITNLFITANRDPRMGKLYVDYLNGWKSRGGDLLMNFADIGTPSKWGSWGALEYVTQESTPKYKALLNYMVGEDFEPILSASLSHTSIAEGEGDAVLSFDLDRAYSEDITVNLLLSGKAQKDSDYIISTQTITIAAGTLGSSETITILDDELIEREENLIIKTELATAGVEQIATPIILKIRDEDGDEDNISDDWERYFGFDPTDATDALSDSDGDGLTNLEEYTGNRNPNRADKESPLPRTNLSGVVDWSSQQPFIDLFKLSRTWITQCNLYANTPDIGCTAANSWDTGEAALLDLDEQGWVKSLPTVEDSPIYTRVATYLALYPEFPKGNYVVRYEGEGTIEYRLAGKKDDAHSISGRDLIAIDPVNGGLHIVLTQINPDNYIRNIQIIPEALEATYSESEPFNPTFFRKDRSVSNAEIYGLDAYQ